MRYLITLILMLAIILGYQKLGEAIAAESASGAGSMEFWDYRMELAGLARLDEYGAIAELPLFDESRRPPVVKVQTVVKQQPVKQKLQIQALGIAVADESILAIVKDLRTGKIQRMRLFEKIDGWELQRVDEDSFVFERDGVDKVVKFRNGRD